MVMWLRTGGIHVQKTKQHLTATATVLALFLPGWSNFLIHLDTMPTNGTNGTNRTNGTNGPNGPNGTNGKNMVL